MAVAQNRGMLDDRHQGRFVIALEIINENPALAKKILNNLIVVSAEYQPQSKSIAYLAVGSMFDECELGKGPQLYVWKHAVAEGEKSPKVTWSPYIFEPQA